MAKVALLIGVSEYEPGLNPLPKAVKDVEAVQRVLKNADLGGFDDVKTLTNPDRVTMEAEVENLFCDRAKDDLVLLFFSGHGVKDDSGKLYFATRNTRKNRRGELVRSTAVPSNFVLEVMNNSRSKRQVVVLDCCFSGAFAEDMTAKDDGSVDIQHQLGSEGRAVLTSSTSTQYSFEEKNTDLSIYTQYLVEGIETGAADFDNDGAISVDELHDYAKQKVQEASPVMKPEIYAAREGFRIRLASAPISDPKLRYRREVERVTNDGRIFLADRRLLNQLQLQLGLLPADAFVIEAAVQQAYWEYQENLEQYRQALSEALQNENPLSEQTQRKFRQLQERWKLKPNDVAAIANQVAQQVQFAHAVASGDVASHLPPPPQPVQPTLAEAIAPSPSPVTDDAPQKRDRTRTWIGILMIALLSGAAGYWLVASQTFVPFPSSSPTPTITPSGDPSTSPIASPTDNPTIPPERCFRVVGTSSLNIRGGAGQSYPQIGVLSEGDELSGGVEDSSGWLKLDLFSVKNKLFPEHQTATEAWVGANYVQPCSDHSLPPSNTDPATTTPTNPITPAPVQPPEKDPPPAEPVVSRCTVCVLYRDRHAGQAVTIEQALIVSGFSTKTISTDLTEVKAPLAPGMVQVVYTEQGLAKLDAVLAIVRPLVLPETLVVEPQPVPKLGKGDEIQIRLY
ncbi:MAG: caspase family protein [Oscillatoriales cyanobacterium C42_A2020_001]|nr:caspase family protein [Leptolyngbyaceae cyanobacterium C42_A2020_001]